MEFLGIALNHSSYEWRRKKNWLNNEYIDAEYALNNDMAETAAGDEFV